MYTEGLTPADDAATLRGDGLGETASGCRIPRETAGEDDSAVNRGETGDTAGADDGGRVVDELSAVAQGAGAHGDQATRPPGHQATRPPGLSSSRVVRSTSVKVSMSAFGSCMQPL